MTRRAEFIFRPAVLGSTVLSPRCPRTVSYVLGSKWSQRNWRSWTWTSCVPDPGVDSSTLTTSTSWNCMCTPASSNLVRTFHLSNADKVYILANLIKTWFYSLNTGPQLSALHLDSSLLVPPKVTPPTTSVQPASSGQPQPSGPDGEQVPGATSSGSAQTPMGATSVQTGEAPQGAASESKGPPSSTTPASTPAETPELYDHMNRQRSWRQ